jgi:DNA-binding GntR family transcriptional regulator
MTRIPKKPLHEEVANRVRELIRDGRLKKGDKIAEKEICDLLGISRTPLREALRVLSSEGLIVMVPHRGAHVAEPSMQEIRQMFEVMAILEGTCARVAAEKMTDAQLRKIERLHEKLETHYRAGDHEKYLKVNHDYHVLIQKMSGNKVLDEVVNGLRQKILLYRYRQLYQPDRFDASMKEHRDLFEAFRARDAQRAEQVMKAHLMSQCEALVSLYQDSEDGTG